MKGKSPENMLAKIGGPDEKMRIWNSYVWMILLKHQELFSSIDKNNWCGWWILDFQLIAKSADFQKHNFRTISSQTHLFTLIEHRVPFTFCYYFLHKWELLKLNHANRMHKMFNSCKNSKKSLNFRAFQPTIT